MADFLGRGNTAVSGFALLVKCYALFVSKLVGRENKILRTNPSEAKPTNPLTKKGSLLLKPGLYQHYKGNQYEVIDTVRHSETEEELVLYRALYGEKGLWVRPLKMFSESVNVDGLCMPRFEYVGEMK